MTLKELRERAKCLGIKGYSRLTKAQLTEQIKAVETPETFAEFVENLFPTPPATPTFYFEGNDRVVQGFAKVRKALKLIGYSRRGNGKDAKIGRYFEQASRLLGFAEVLPSQLKIALRLHQEGLRSANALGRACQYSLLAVPAQRKARGRSLRGLSLFFSPAVQCP